MAPSFYMTQSIRKTAPEPLAPISFAIPPSSEATLKNGLRIVVFEDHRLPLVSYRLMMRTGDRNDPKGWDGLASAVTSLLTEGTRSYSSKQLAEEIEKIGATVSASTSEDFTIIAASALSLYNSEVLRLLEEIVLTPTFPENELDLYKRNAVEHLKFQRSQPGFLAGEQTARLLYGTHPYARITPTAEDIERLSRRPLVDFHAETFVPNISTLIVVGDVNTADIVSDIDSHLGKWQRRDKHEPAFDALPERSIRTLTIVDRPGSAQSNIVIANPGIKRNHADYFPMLVMNQVLGAGASSRIFMNLREEKGYTYGAYTRFDAKQLAGDFEATAEVRSAVTSDSLKEFFYELERIRTEKVSEDELADAKNFLTGVFPLRAETQEGLTNLLVTQYLYDLPSDYLQTYRDKVSAITADQVQEAARKYVLPDLAAIVIVGDAEEILVQAINYAEHIEIFDTEGNPKELLDYAEPKGDAVSVDGKWDLSIDMQGQKLSVTMRLNQDGETVGGTIQTMLGEGKIESGKVQGSKMTAAAKTEIQGESVEFAIVGTVDGNSMAGTITAPMIPQPLSFTGIRQA